MIWSVCEHLSEANRRIGSVCSHDISLAFARISEFVERDGKAIAGIDETMRNNCFGHLGDGNLPHNVSRGSDRMRLTKSRKFLQLTSLFRAFCAQLSMLSQRVRVLRGSLKCRIDVGSVELCCGASMYLEKRISPEAVDQTPLVSVVMIFLDGEEYIAEAIDSILAQSFSDWELILVDDGSTDGSTGIAQGYARRHPDKIRYLAHPGRANLGMSASRNTGIAAARGDLIAFLDCDDVWLPERLSRHVDELARHPEVAMTVSPTIYWSSWKSAAGIGGRPWLKVDLHQELGLPAGRVIEAPASAILCLDSRGEVPGICSVTIRKDALNAVGGGDASFRSLYEDQVLFFKMFLEFPCFVIDESLDLYRQHTNSTCWQAAKVGGDTAVRVRFLDWLQGHIETRGVSDRDLDRVLSQAKAQSRSGGSATPAGAIAKLKERWNMESRLFTIWALTPAVYQRLRSFYLALRDRSSDRGQGVAPAIFHHEVPHQ